jgi:hypothetical protein
VQWGRESAGVYDVTQAAMFDRAVLDPMVMLLAELVAGGRALEFAVGTGRVALPLRTRACPRGVFAVEVVVPQFTEFPPSSVGRVFVREDDHLAIETFDDVAEQLAWSHHWMPVDGRLVRHSAPYRYVWPSELDLMARIAGLERRERWCGWRREPFPSTSIEQVVVYEKPR